MTTNRQPGRVPSGSRPPQNRSREVPSSSGLKVSSQVTRVLLIDDDQDDFVLTRSLLQEIVDQDFQLDWVQTFDEGCERVLADQHDVYLVDYRLGVDDGLELIRECLSQGRPGPFILLTAQRDRDLDLRAMKVGASDFLVKSDTTPEILERSIRYSRRHIGTLMKLQHTAWEHSLLASAVQNLGTAVLITDATREGHHVVFVNPGFTALTGYRASEIIGRSLSLLRGPETDPDTLERVEQAYCEGTRLRTEIVKYRKNGEPYWCDLTVSPIFDEQGRLTNIIELHHDVTKEKEAQKESRAKSDFLAVMSHELRTPLNSVIGFTNVLLKNEERNLSPTQIKYLERVSSNGEHLLRIINDILDISRIEAGAVSVQSERVDLRRLVSETVQQLEGRLTEKALDLQLDVPGLPIYLNTDPQRLKQVLINLVDNAIKFTEEGFVRVSICRDREGNPTAIRVSDSGIGIPEDQQAKIFEPFTQAVQGLNRTYQGTGLGTTIARSLCRMLGFHLSLSSQPGKGTTFTIRLGR